MVRDIRAFCGNKQRWVWLTGFRNIQTAKAANPTLTQFKYIVRRA